MNDGRASIVVGMAICWLLNVAQVCIGWLLLVADVRMLSTFYVLVGAVGIVQVGYVVPISHLLWRKSKRWTARGVLIAAAITALVNALMALLILKFHVLGTR